MSSDVMLQAQTAAYWEEAKGKLRAMAVVAAHRRLTSSTSVTGEAASQWWGTLDGKIEAFIHDVEDGGLCE